MPKLLPNKVHSKTLELLKLVRKPSSQQRVMAFFRKLPESEQIKIALDLHENIEIIFYQQEDLRQSIATIYAKYMSEFEALMYKFRKHAQQPLGLEIANDIITRFDINQFAENGTNLLLVAAKLGNVALVKALLEKGADPTIEPPVYQSLIKRWSAWNFIIKELANPAISAQTTNYQQIFDAFIKHNANPTFGHTLRFITELDNPKQIAYFTQLPQVKFVKQLFKIISTKLYAPFQIPLLMHEYNKQYNFDTVTLDALLNARNEKGQTALIHAVIEENTIAVKALLDLKVDANIQDVDGNTALHHACMSDNFDICSLLVQYRNPEDPQCEVSIILANKAQVTGLDLLLQHEFYTIPHSNQAYDCALSLIDDIADYAIGEVNNTLKNLVSGKSRINVKDVFNYLRPEKAHSVLLSCAQAGNLDVLKFIIESDIVDNLEQQLSKAFRYATYHDNVSILKYLHSLGVNINTQDEQGISALQIASQYRSDACFDFLISKAADRNLKNFMGNSALDLALVNGNLKAAQVLLKGNLKLAGYTDLMLAIINNDIKNAVKLLKSNPPKTTDVTQGGFNTLMIATMQFAATNAQQTKDKLFELILELIPNSDILHTNKIKLNFLQLFKNANPQQVSSEITPENITKLYHACSTPKFIQKHGGKNFLHICAILGFDFSSFYDPIFSKDIPVAKLNSQINALDADGNSPLSYLLFDTEAKFAPEQILNMVEHGAKFIRNHKEVKKSHHIKAMFADDEIPSINLKELNEPDYEGRTVFHIACMRNNLNMALKLRDNGANIDQQDIYGRTPLHYASQHGVFLSYRIATHSWDIADNIGITPLVFAMQNADNASFFVKLQSLTMGCTSYINTILISFFNITQPNHIDEKINTIVNDTQLDYKQKLALINALRNYTKIIDPEENPALSARQNETLRLSFKDTDRYDFAEHEIMQVEFNKKDQYKNVTMPKGFAIGIELEVPGIPDSYVPSEVLPSLYPIAFTFDATVSNTLLSSNVLPSDDAKLELVSDILDTHAKYAQFMDLCKTLQDTGATINASAGMHVHFNCRGSQLPESSTARFVSEAQELDYLKYVALNYIRIENLLRGFMRGGNLYNLYGAAYVQSIGEYEADIRDCNNVAELQAICSHNKTLDFTALDRHGTIEFRIHDATVNPILINAWVDCLSRLVLASRKQAENHKIGQPYNTIPNIEELVALFITMRQYNITWDPNWANFKGAETITADKKDYLEKYKDQAKGVDKLTTQDLIQKSPLYGLAQLFIVFNKNETRGAKAIIEDYISSNAVLFKEGKYEKNRILQDLQDLLIVVRDNPGLHANSPDIEPALHAINDLLHPTTLRKHR